MLKNLVSAFALLWASNALAQSNIEIIQLDIGQGDATLIVSTLSPDSIITILFDAGGYTTLSGEDAGAIIHQVLSEKNISRVDYLVVSHYDADHIGGIINEGHGNMYKTSFVLGPDGQENTSDDIEVVNVIDRGDERPPSSKIYQKYVDFTATTNRISLTNRSSVPHIIDLGPNAKMTCIAANGFVVGRDRKVSFVNTENERSLSFILEYRDFDYLISGDLIGRRAGSENAQVEKVLGDFLRRNNINVDVLHVNHHGANNTSETEFLTTINAEVAVISCGDDNNHDHPTLGNLSRMVDAEIEMIFQTNGGNPADSIPNHIQEKQKNFDGHVVIKTDGQTYDVYKYGYSQHSGYFFQFSCDQ